MLCVPHKGYSLKKREGAWTNSLRSLTAAGAIWEMHGEGRREESRRVCKLQGVVLFLEDVTSRFALPLTAESKLDGSDCKVRLG